MTYGDLSLRDRLVRGAIGAVMGGGAGFLLMLRLDLFGRQWERSTLLLPATVIGATIGGFLAFRRTRIGF